MRQYLRVIIPVLIPLIILMLPASAFPVEGLTVVQQRVIAIFLLAALCWVLEPIPIYATSVVIIVLELMLLSDKGLYLFRGAEGQPHFGELLSYSDIMATFASPIIMLFLGGFFLAMAATKYRLDVNLARVLLKPFGTQPKYVMFGLMLITAIFSMFMSNTATTAMMLSILAPVIALFGAKDPGKIAFALCIPVAANIGGIGTPIGTPPNAIALKYLTGDNLITFGEWMFFGVPFVAVLLVFAWVLINALYPAKQEKNRAVYQGQVLDDAKGGHCLCYVHTDDNPVVDGIIPRYELLHCRPDPGCGVLVDRHYQQGRFEENLLGCALAGLGRYRSRPCIRPDGPSKAYGAQHSVRQFLAIHRIGWIGTVVLSDGKLHVPYRDGKLADANYGCTGYIHGIAGAAWR